MNECPECDGEMIYSRGFPQTDEMPEEVAGWTCEDCGHFQYESPGERAIAAAEASEYR